MKLFIFMKTFQAGVAQSSARMFSLRSPTPLAITIFPRPTHWFKKSFSMMLFGVLSNINYSQILQPVIGFYTIFMMDLLSFSKLPANMLLHYIAMFQKIIPSHQFPEISTRMFTVSSFPFIVASAKSSTNFCLNNRRAKDGSSKALFRTIFKLFFPAFNNLNRLITN